MPSIILFFHLYKFSFCGVQLCHVCIWWWTTCNLQDLVTVGVQYNLKYGRLYISKVFLKWLMYFLCFGLFKIMHCWLFKTSLAIFCAPLIYFCLLSSLVLLFCSLLLPLFFAGLISHLFVCIATRGGKFFLAHLIFDKFMWTEMTLHELAKVVHAKEAADSAR